MQNLITFIAQISPNEEGYCGSLEPFTVAAKSKRLYITFKSDDVQKDNSKGFNVTFLIKKTLGKNFMDTPT